MGQNQCCFALLYEFVARGISELMLVVKQKTKFNYIVLKGTRLKRTGEGKRSKGHHEKVVDTNFFSSPLTINVKFMLH